MVNKKWLVISYFCIFLSIYLLSIVYTLFAFYLQKEYFIEAPRTETMNSTISTISQIPSFTSPIVIITIIISIIIIFCLLLNSFRAMGNAI